jgi:gamma-glutamylcyclotransferase
MGGNPPLHVSNGRQLILSGGKSRTMKSIRYFSYGSNMSSRRLMSRAPLAKFLCTAMLQGHRLQFHKKGRDGSAKCDALYTASPDDCIIGVVFEISASEKAILDRTEGLGQGYKEKAVTVHGEKGDSVEAVTYYATNIDPSLKPFHWYKEHVLRGAREHRLPSGYVAGIEKTEALADPDQARHAEELAIYG